MIAAPPTSKRKITLILLAVGATTIFGHAAQADSLLLREEVADLAGITFQSYKAGRVNEMLRQENECWDDARQANGEIRRTLVAACATTAMAGAIIEATYARSQRRGSHPDYTGEGARKRIFRRSGLSENETQRIMEETVETNVPAIMSGLQGAGMR